MRIAVIEDSEDYRTLISESIRDHNDWDVDYFPNAEDFGTSDLKKYDVIVADYILPSVDGRSLLKSIQSKTQAELFLMSAMAKSFSEEDILNDNINGLIDKTNIQSLLEQLRYSDVKIRINKVCEAENNKLNEIISNGFSAEIKDDILILRVHAVLSESSKKRIMEKIEISHINKTIISFPDRDSINSQYLGMLAYFFNVFKSRKGKIVFWNARNSESVLQQIKTCGLDKLYMTFETLEESLKYLN